MGVPWASLGGEGGAGVPGARGVADRSRIETESENLFEGDRATLKIRMLNPIEGQPRQ